MCSWCRSSRGPRHLMIPAAALPSCRCDSASGIWNLFVLFCALFCLLLLCVALSVSTPPCSSHVRQPVYMNDCLRAFQHQRPCVVAQACLALYVRAPSTIHRPRSAAKAPLRALQPVAIDFPALSSPPHSLPSTAARNGHRPFATPLTSPIRTDVAFSFPVGEPVPAHAKSQSPLPAVSTLPSFVPSVTHARPASRARPGTQAGGRRGDQRTPGAFSGLSGDGAMHVIGLQRHLGVYHSTSTLHVDSGSPGAKLVTIGRSKPQSPLQRVHTQNLAFPSFGPASPQ